MNFEKVLVVTTGIKNSRGHEIHGKAIKESLRRFTKVEVRTLKELDSSLLGRFIIWPLIQFGKQLTSDLSSLRFDDALRGKETKKGYKESLTTKLIGRGFKNFLKKHPSYKDIPIISSHYAAIAAARDAGHTKNILVGPDFFPHDQTAIPETLITSPSDSFSNELISYGVKEENIKQIGTVITPGAARNAEKYRELRMRVASGKENPMHILITIGGAGPETKYVLDTVKRLKELILMGHQLCSITLVVGDGRPGRRRLRRKFMGIIKNQILEDTEGCGFRIFGGVKGYEKKDEVNKTWELLESSLDTNGFHPVDLIFTRPNDMSLISATMGIPTILYAPSGSHEIKARHYLSKELKSALLYEEWIKLKHPGEVINLGKPLEMAFEKGSVGFITSDSGEKLIDVVREAVGRNI